MRIFVFRPPAEAERTAAAIRAHGHEPIVAPLFEVLRLPDPAPEGPFAAIVLTSGNAFRRSRSCRATSRTCRSSRWARARPRRCARPGSWMRAAPTAIARIWSAWSADNLSAPARLLLIVGRDRHEDVGDRLVEAGFAIATWVAYEAQALARFPLAAQETLQQGGVDGALHYSARGAKTCLSLAREAGVTEALLDLTHVALSADVAGPLISAGCEHRAGGGVSRRGSAAGGARPSVRSQSPERGC